MRFPVASEWAWVREGPVSMQSPFVAQGYKKHIFVEEYQVDVIGTHMAEQ